MTPSEIEPSTFRLVAQCIDQLRQRMPPVLAVDNVTQGVFFSPTWPKTPGSALQSVFLKAKGYYYWDGFSSSRH
jgi:hypothetical protein